MASAVLWAVLAVLLGPVLRFPSTPFVPLSSLFAERISVRSQHVLVWGGLHGSLSLALALSLGRDFPDREKILALTFGVVAFSIIVQGLTIGPLIRWLRLSTTDTQDEFAVARVRQIASFCPPGRTRGTLPHPRDLRARIRQIAARVGQPDRRASGASGGDVRARLQPGRGGDANGAPAARRRREECH